MPSPHRRIGLVVDEPFEEVLDLLRATLDAHAPEARLAREAFFEGAALEAIRRAAGAGGENGRRAGQVIELVQDLLPTLELPRSVEADLMKRIDRTIETVSGERRRQRQLALLRSPSPYGEAVLDATEELDELERLPG